MSQYPAIVSPGEQLRDVVHDAGLTIDDAAARLGVSADRLANVMAGRERITPALSRRLGDLLGQSPTFWANRQAERDRRVEEAARAVAGWSAGLNQRLADR
ncbi:helix-turn-helix transcriptional regulator [Gordonia tangerina]|uniref:Helix-turn-helix domain-containing protein n=1 Tax=Gordonia tangerina TaxID=2911060 RepID=A0ABS9DGK0_9ACTN|nr:helix-turn-helix domain-containing protein [Gordonia tangerina]MCF3936993.1 helix-turn-helix domain-containing protein [Gordonia tangerina]